MKNFKQLIQTEGLEVKYHKTIFVTTGVAEVLETVFYKISKKLNIGLLFYLLICYNSIKEVIRND